MRNKSLYNYYTPQRYELYCKQELQQRNPALCDFNWLTYLRLRMSYERVIPTLKYDQKWSVPHFYTLILRHCLKNQSQGFQRSQTALSGSHWPLNSNFPQNLIDWWDNHTLMLSSKPTKVLDLQKHSFNGP